MKTEYVYMLSTWGPLSQMGQVRIEGFLAESPQSFLTESLVCQRACIIKCHKSLGVSAASWLTGLCGGNYYYFSNYLTVWSHFG